MTNQVQYAFKMLLKVNEQIQKHVKSLSKSKIIITTTTIAVIMIIILHESFPDDTELNQRP